MQNSWLSLLPPLIVLIIACTTKKLNRSLTIGLFIAALIATNGSVVNAVSLLANRLYAEIIDFDNICNYSFLIIISALVVLISRTGGAIAFAHAITQRLKTRRMVETTSLMVSSTLFIDDYLSNLTTGYAMRPISDRFAIPRVKLAFLVHSLSSPLVILAPVSSWVAMLIVQLENADISTHLGPTTKIVAEPFYTYLQAIPFNFYSLLLIASTWIIVRKGLSYGPMRKHEIIAHTDGNLFGGKQAPQESLAVHENPRATAFDLIIPVGLLIATVFLGFLYDGGFMLFGGAYGVIEALQHATHTPQVLLAAGIITLMLSSCIAIMRQTIALGTVPTILREGTLFIYSSILMIFLAATLGKFLKVDLLTGNYLASLLLGSFPFWALPAMFFLVATIISFFTGSSWGTIALTAPMATQIVTVMTPGVAPFALEAAPMLLPVIGGLFAGAICGNHISPISDTTMLASASCGTYPLDHVYTQFPYALPAIISSAIAFIAVGHLVSYGKAVMLGASLGIGALCCVVMLAGLQRWYK